MNKTLALTTRVSRCARASPAIALAAAAAMAVGAASLDRRRLCSGCRRGDCRRRDSRIDRDHRRRHRLVCADRVEGRARPS